MPIYNSSGQAVRGIYGGYRQGQKDERGARQQEGKITEQNLANRSTNAEFWDYIEEESARTAEYEEREAEANKNTRLMDVQEKAEHAEFDATKAEEELNEDVAKEKKKLVKTQGKLNEELLKKGFRDLNKSFNLDNMEHLVGVVASLREGLQQPGADREALYMQTHRNLLNNHPEGIQKAAEIYEAMGIPTRWSEAAESQILALEVEGIHDIKTQQTNDINRHRLALEAEWASKQASRKPPDLTHPRPTPTDRQDLGVRMKSWMPEIWDDLSGSGWDEKTKTWGKSKGAMVSSVSTIARTAQSMQKVGVNVSPEDIEIVFMDFISSMEKSYPGTFIRQANWLLDKPGLGSSDDHFMGNRFEPAAKGLLTLLGNDRLLKETELKRHVSLTSVWGDKKDQMIEYFRPKKKK